MNKKLLILLTVLALTVCLLTACASAPTVTFDPQNGQPTFELKLDKEFKLPEKPTNGDKIFAGWFTDKDGSGSEWDQTATQDITVYAKWINPISVTFDAQNGSVETLAFAGIKELPTPTNGTKEFGGWYTDKDCTEGNEWTLPATLEQDVTVYAKWIDVYFVTFNAQNGGEAQTVKFDSEFAIPANPEKEGFAFLGWYTDEACTEGNEWQKPETLTEDVTVYGKWGEKFYITLNSNVNGQEPVVVLFEYGMTLPEPYNGLKSFGGWFTDQKCTAGNEWTLPGTLASDITVYAKWKAHVHDYGDNYLMFVECRHPECYNIGRNKSTNSAKENFVYNFDNSAKERINALYQELLDGIADGENYDPFEEKFLAYDKEVSYVIEQYQYAYVFYKTYTDESYKEKFDEISEYRNEIVSCYYGLFRKVYESPYKDLFYEGWTEEEIAEALALADTYGDDAYKSIKDDIDALLLEYDAMMDDEDAAADDFSRKYAQLVKLNNSLARQLGYDNYMEYAYAVKFERDYSPADVAEMRAFVKKYMVPVTDAIYAKYEGISFKSADSNYTFYSNISGASVFKTTSSSKFAANYMASYLMDMTSDSYKDRIDFYYHANELMKNGNYYTGRDDGAFSYWISAQQTSILFFGESTDKYGNYRYQDAFTFIHEFGHYYNNIYNKGLSLCMDHDETQSQGDEMMFLAWLAKHCDPDTEAYGYEAVSTIQLVNMMYIICIATAVDEFEQAAYTGSYNGNPLPTIPSSTDVDYNVLFSKILSSYSSLISDQKDYWYRVAFQSAGYYISYAMSALPCVELYVYAMNNFDYAKDVYFKIFTFSDNEKFVKTDENGNRSVIATYAEILNYAGLKSPFQKELYTTIARYYGVKVQD